MFVLSRINAVGTPETVAATIVKADVSEPTPMTFLA